VNTEILFCGVFLGLEYGKPGRKRNSAICNLWTLPYWIAQYGCIVKVRLYLMIHTQLVCMPLETASVTSVSVERRMGTSHMPSDPAY
jgi:hypothetical protein